MKITKMYAQHRRDFKFDAFCENCGHKVIGEWGYDDTNFHQNVIPAMLCKECGKPSPAETERPTPRYSDGQSV